MMHQIPHNKMREGVRPVLPQAIGSASMPAPMAVPATRKVAPRYFPFMGITVLIELRGSFNGYGGRCKFLVDYGLVSVNVGRRNTVSRLTVYVIRC